MASNGLWLSSGAHFLEGAFLVLLFLEAPFLADLLEVERDTGLFEALEEGCESKTLLMVDILDILAPPTFGDMRFMSLSLREVVLEGLQNLDKVELALFNFSRELSKPGRPETPPRSLPDVELNEMSELRYVHFSTLHYFLP